MQSGYKVGKKNVGVASTRNTPFSVETGFYDKFTGSLLVCFLLHAWIMNVVGGACTIATMAHYMDDERAVVTPQTPSRVEPYKVSLVQV